jgi:hypothetical protein
MTRVVQMSLDGSVKSRLVDSFECTPCSRYVETRRNEDYEDVHANAVRLYHGVFWCFACECSRWAKCAEQGVMFYWSPLRARHVLAGGKYNSASVTDESAKEIERLGRDLKQFTEEYR